MNLNRLYNTRMIQIEHGTMTPLIFTTTGVMSPECSKYHKALAEKISEKRGKIRRYNEIYSSKDIFYGD